MFSVNDQSLLSSLFLSKAAFGYKMGFVGVIANTKAAAYSFVGFGPGVKLNEKVLTRLDRTGGWDFHGQVEIYDVVWLQCSRASNCATASMGKEDSASSTYSLPYLWRWLGQGWLLLSQQGTLLQPECSKVKTLRWRLCFRLSFISANEYLSSSRGEKDMALDIERGQFSIEMGWFYRQILVVSL